MSEATAGEARPGRWRRGPWWRPGPRAVVEAAVLVAAGFGLVAMKGRGEFPRPMIRALRSGSAADQAEALRGLSLFGRAGEEAVPALLDALRDDPSPSVRRGSAFVLAAIVAAPQAVEPFSLDQLLAGDEGLGLEATGDGSPPPRPHPRLEGVAAGLVRSVREDPDPTVRGEAIAALGPLLDAALGLRPPTEAPVGMPRFVGPPAPPRSAFPVAPWMRDAAGAIADRAGSGSAPESRRATAWVHIDPAARLLLGDDRQADAVVRGGARAAQVAETFLDVQIVKATALAVRDDPDRRDMFLDAMARAMARPRPATPAGPPNSPSFAGGSMARPLDPDEHAIPFWVAGPSARELADHPGAIAAVSRLLAWDWRHGSAYVANVSGSGIAPIASKLQALNDLAVRRTTLLNWSIDGLLLPAIRDDPAIAGLLGDRLGAEQWRRLLETRGAWDELSSAWLDPARRPDLPPDRAEEVAAVLFEVGASIPDDAPARHRALAALAYFVRGTAPESKARSRLRSMAEAMRDDPREEGRAMGRRLLEGVAAGGGASP